MAMLKRVRWLRERKRGNSYWVRPCREEASSDRFLTNRETMIFWVPDKQRNHDFFGFLTNRETMIFWVPEKQRNHDFLGSWQTDKPWFFGFLTNRKTMIFWVPDKHRNHDFLGSWQTEKIFWVPDKQRNHDFLGSWQTEKPWFFGFLPNRETMIFCCCIIWFSHQLPYYGTALYTWAIPACRKPKGIIFKLTFWGLKIPVCHFDRTKPSQKTFSRNKFMFLLWDCIINFF